MRLSVRGLAGRPVRLDEALADWRAEVITRLQQAAVEALLGESGETLSYMLSARLFMQVTRILREAVSNVIKHSAATALRGAAASSEDAARSGPCATTAGASAPTCSAARACRP